MMNRTVIALALTAQLAATGTAAQTSDMVTEPTDRGKTSSAFGSDWSGTLRSGMLGENGTTVRSEPEIISQWATLSDDDRSTIRRDCMVFMQQPDASNGASAAGGMTSASGSSPTTNLTTDQMAHICAVTKDL